MARNWLYSRFNTFLERHMPEGLFPRALIILVAPVVLLQTIMTGLILERHFENVTRLLARSYARDVALLVQLYEESDKSTAAEDRIEKLANGTLNLGLTITTGQLPEGSGSSMPSHIRRVEPLRPAWQIWTPIFTPGSATLRAAATTRASAYSLASE